MSKELEEVRRLITSFQYYVTIYPNNKDYQKTLLELQQKEVDLINKIGRK